MEENDALAGFWDKIRYMFNNHDLLFEIVRKETGIRKALIMYSIIGAFFSTVYFAFFFGLMFMLGGMSGGFSPSLMTLPSMQYFFFIISVVSTFVYSCLIHVTILAFRGEGKFPVTYNVYTYSMIPYLILSSIPVLGFFSIIYSFILMIKGVSKLHGLSKLKSALACLLPAAIILILIIVFLLSFA